MKNKLLLAFGLIACIITGCVKDLQKAGVSETTKLKGRVLEESQLRPIADVKVLVTNGEKAYLNATTDHNGEFSMEIDFGNVDKDCYVFLKMDDNISVITKRLELMGMGKALYDYGEIYLYNQNEGGVPTVTTSSASEIGETSAKGGGNVTSNGGSTVTERGICWSTSQNPTIADRTAEGGSGTGTFSCEMTNLTPNTKYFVRAYAINRMGISYGSTKNFTTLASGSSITIPVVKTNSAGSITATGATCGGNVTSDGGSSIIRRGVCWSTSSNPVENTGQTAYHNNNTTGAFTCDITGLSPNTTYHFRAFAVNEKGIGYGEDKTFTTSQATTEAWLTYYDDSDLDAWGLINGGDDEWAVMFPASSLVPYSGTSITKVRAFFNVTGRYYLKIYEGGTTEPTTLKKSLYYDINSTGWTNLLVNPGYSLNTSSSLWVSLSFNYSAGQYPRCAGQGVNNPNSRWARANAGLWHDAYDHNGEVDLCWSIQVFVTNDAKDERGGELILPSKTAQENREASRLLPLRTTDLQSVKATKTIQP